MLPKAIITRFCVTLAFVVLLSINLNAQTADNQNLRAIVEAAETRTKVSADKLQGYKYTVRRYEQELNEAGEVKSEKFTVFQAFPGTKGIPILVKLSEDGKDLSTEQLVKEKRQANKLWKKAKEETGAKVKNVITLPSISENSEFSLLRMDNFKGREVMILRFTPKPVGNSKEFLSQLEGELWIDLKEKIFARIEGKFSERYRLGGSLIFRSYLEPGSSILVEAAPLPNGIWATTLTESTSILKGPLYIKFPLKRLKEEKFDYVPLDSNADKLFTDL